MIRATTLAVLLFCSASLLAAESIRFDPPNPHPKASVDAIVSGNWPDGCPPEAGAVSVTGSTVTLRLNPSSLPRTSCDFERPTPHETRFHLGILPAGVYTVVVTGGITEQSELGRQTLIVRDRTLLLRPYAIPTSGQQVIIGNPFDPDPAVVTIDGVVAARATPTGGASQLVTAPPHAAGAVDITVSRGNEHVTWKAALIYFDPADADPAVFEPILFPVAYAGPGAFGSQWTTKNMLILHGQSWFRHGPACGFCLTQSVPNTSEPWGKLLYGMRGTIDHMAPKSYIREESWGEQNAGTEIPVAREDDFRAETLLFVDVPGDPAHWRVMLRVWTLDEPDDYHLNAGGLPVPLTMMKIPGAPMWFGTVDLTPHLFGNSEVSVWSETAPLPRAWGMLTITNNATQQVTIRSSW